MERIRQLKNDKEEAQDQLRAILGAAERGKRNLDPEERTKATELGEQIDKIAKALRLEEDALEHDRRHAPAIDRSGGMSPFALDDEADPAFASLPPMPARTRRRLEALAGPNASSTEQERRESWRAVAAAALGGDPFHPAILAATSTEGVGSEGGFGVKPDVAAGIWSRAFEESVFARIGTPVEPMISDQKEVVALDDATDASDAESGLTAAWMAETADATAQVMLVRRVTLQAKKLMVLAATSNELGEDAPAYLDELELALARAIGKKFDRAMVSGTGAGQPLGLLNSAATIEVAKTVAGDPGSANSFTWKHATGMWARLAPGLHESSWWLVHPTVLPALHSMSVVIPNQAATDVVGGFQPNAAFTAGGVTGYQLLSRPVVITSRVKSLTTRGDVVLLAPSEFRIGIRRAITVDRSPHAYFSSDRLAVRAKFRGDGLCLWNTTKTLAEGSVTVGPAVVLQSR